MQSDFTTLRTSRFLIPTTLFFVAGIFVMQLAIPFGWALGGLYIAPLTLCAFWSSFRHIFLVVWIGTLCTILSTIVFFGSSFWDSKVTMAMAYIVPVGSMWFITILSLIRKSFERRSKQRASLQTLCASCKQVCTDGSMCTIEQYSRERMGTFLGVGFCDQCATKQGMQY